jgi:hypothetical protein
MSFDELRSDFQAVQKEFAEAETLDEKQRLLAISKQIITEANASIEEFRRRLSLY